MAGSLLIHNFNLNLHAGRVQTKKTKMEWVINFALIFAWRALIATSKASKMHLQPFVFEVVLEVFVNMPV